MLKPYPIAIGLKTAWRNVIKSKLFSIINVILPMAGT